MFNLKVKLYNKAVKFQFVASKCLEKNCIFQTKKIYFSNDNILIIEILFHRTITKSQNTT